MMPGELISPEQMKEDGAPARCAASSGAAISTYIITPYNVDILGDLIDELENNGLYF